MNLPDIETKQKNLRVAWGKFCVEFGYRVGQSVWPRLQFAQMTKVRFGAFNCHVCTQLVGKPFSVPVSPPVRFEGYMTGNDIGVIQAEASEP